MVILENIDIDKAILQNIDIDEISNRFKFGISNRASPGWPRKRSISTIQHRKNGTPQIQKRNPQCSNCLEHWGTSLQNLKLYDIVTCASQFDILLSRPSYWLFCSLSNFTEYHYLHLNWGQSFKFQISLHHSIWQTPMHDSYILAPSMPPSLQTLNSPKTCS